MSNVLIRDVPADDLDALRAAAAQRGTSLQSFLREAVHAHAVHLRRQETLREISERLSGRPAVSDEERAAVLDVVDKAHGERAEQLSGPREQ